MSLTVADTRDAMPLQGRLRQPSQPDASLLADILELVIQNI